MKLVEFAVRRGTLILLLTMILAIFCIRSFVTTPRSVDPHFSIPTVIVTVTQPGAEATDIEETITRPIEETLQGLDDIDELSSTSSDSVAIIVAEFDWGSNAEKIFDDVVREVGAIRDRLPGGIAEIEFRRIRTTESKLLQYALVSETASFRRMEKIAEDLRDLINTDPDVRRTEIWGLERPRVQVSLDTGRLSELNLPVGAVVDAIASDGTDLPVGTVVMGPRRLNIEAGGAFESLREVRDVAVRSMNGAVVRVRDIASVEWVDPPRTHITRANDTRAIFVTVEQKDGTNAVEIRNRLTARVDQFRSRMPLDTELIIAFDQAQDIERVIAYLARDFAIALLLVTLTLLPLGLRASLVVIISIPLSLGIGILILGSAGFTLNQLSVSGFILALGLVVDDAIVVVENVSRRMRQGLDRAGAAIAGTQEVLGPVLGTTAVIIFAFLPLAFLPEGAGSFTRSLPLAVMTSVAGSLLVALVVIPFLASRLLARNEDPEGNRLLRAINRVVHGFYRPMLRRALDWPRTTLIAAAAACCAAFGLVPVLGFSLFPAADTPYFLVDIEASEGASVEETDRIVRQASAMIAEEGLRAGRFDNVGAGNPKIFYNRMQREKQANFGQILVTTGDWDNRTGPALLERLRDRLAHIPDAHIAISPFKNGLPVSAPIAFSVIGPDISKLKTLAAQVEGSLRSTPGTRNVQNRLALDQIDLNIGFDSAKAAVLDIAPGDARQAIRVALEGLTAAQLRDEEGDSYDVTVNLPGSERRKFEDLDKIFVPARNGASIPLSQITEPYLTTTPALIERYDLQRTATVTADVAPELLSSRVTEDAIERIAALKLPPGYRIAVRGEAEARQDSFAGLGSIALVSFAGILIVLLIEFGNLRLVWITLGVVPLGMFGGLVALFLTGNSLSYVALIGFIAMIGIEIKTSVLLVDFAWRMREQGVPLRQAVEQASEIRFLPVLLTAATAIGGLLPLAVSGAALYSPLAWVIIGGLLSSTLLSRIVTPVLYQVIESGWRGTPPERTHPPATA